MPTYKVVRNFFRSDVDKVVVATNLTLEEAQQHCSDPDTSSNTCTTAEGQALTEKYGDWFDSFGEE